MPFPVHSLSAASKNEGFNCANQFLRPFPGGGTCSFRCIASVVAMSLDSRLASRISQHLNAVRSLTYHGDASALDAFRGESFEINGIRYEFLTDTTALLDLADAGELEIERLYQAIQGDE